MKQQGTPATFEMLADQLAPIAVADIATPDISGKEFEDYAEEFDQTVDRLLRHTPRSGDFNPKRHMELAGGSLTVEADYWRDCGIGFMDSRGTTWVAMDRTVRLELAQDNLGGISATFEFSTSRRFHVDDGEKSAGKAKGVAEIGYTFKVPRPTRVWRALGDRRPRHRKVNVEGSETAACYELPDVKERDEGSGLYLFAGGVAILKAVKPRSMRVSQESKER